MALSSLQIEQFRCFESEHPEFSPGTNLIVGENAAGKTSLLEAIFVLGRGRSFRTHKTRTAIRHEASAFRLVGRVVDVRDRRVVVGMERSREGTVLRIGGQEAKSVSHAAALLPVVVLDSGVHQLVAGEPEVRRRFVDWGVFHVEHRFLEAWKRYRRAVSQRNELLRTRGDARMLTPWDREVSESGETVDRYRGEYLAGFLEAAERVASEALGGRKVRLEFRKGWRGKETLAAALARMEESDRRLGFTQAGPHRAELKMLIDGQPASEVVSRGQQKMLASYLMLEQARDFHDRTGRRPAVLVDDLPAELDAGNREKLIGLLPGTGGQLFVTAIEPESLTGSALSPDAMFHVEHGRIHRR